MNIQKQYKTTSRRKTAYYRMGEGNARKLILLHGNVSSGGFYLPLMERLKDKFDILAPDLNGYGKTEASPINSKTGLLDWAKDIDALAESLGFGKFILTGWSLSGGIAMKYAIEYPEKLEALVLISPMSPFGFGGTIGEEGKMISEDGLGSAGGFVNPDFLKSLAAKDKSDAPGTIRDVMRKSYFKPGFIPEKKWEDFFVDEIMDMKLGPDYYPGDLTQTAEFPYVLPGTKGTNNCLAPQYANVSAIADIPVKPPILWFRGDSDTLVSDNSFSDLAVLGKMGIVPGYPGEDKMPPQPMVSQTRYIFEKYKTNGGKYKEFIIEGAGHSCHIEKENEFISLFLSNI